MLYFIFWVVFLLVVILSVPIVSFLEKRKRQAAQGPKDEQAEEFAGEDEAEVAEAEAAEAEFEAAEDVSGEGDDFAEFEEVR